ncbi:UPF0575 protein C19orf67 homolog isoform X2 [Cynoglossus semilaevis]|nr:UPF0575 protein C19orf67 homolog isoform X2 [Cynoglossus semilaevis]
METSLQILQPQLLCLMSKADDLHKCLDKEKSLGESQALAAKVPSFLFTCQPFFNHLQATAWNSVSQNTGLPLDISTRLLDLSQQLFDKLEQLVLTYAQHGLLSLDETEPNSVSHFCIGQSQISHLRVTAFRYCRLTPYLAKVNTGLYKRMRWNVERLQEQQDQQTDEEPGGKRQQCAAHTVGETDYYFLCCEDIPNTPADDDSSIVCSINMAKMWSIGQWVQVKPDPNSEDIYDWITCETPQASYHRLLLLGSEEPTCCSATDLLQKLLLSDQTPQ